MKVYTFFKENLESFLETVANLKDKLDFCIFFIPPKFYLDSDSIEKIYNHIYPIRFITLSAVGVMESDKLGYDCFGGFGVKFERGGSFEILKIESFSDKNIDKVAKEVSDFLSTGENCTYLIFSVSENRYLNKLLNIIFKREKAPKVRLYGGIASSNLKDFKTFISVDREVYEDALIIIKLVNVISYNTVSFGFIPVGPSYKITKSYENQIFEIDGMSAEYFLFNLLNNTGIKPAELNKELTSEILWEFPLLLIEPEKKYIKSIRTFKRFNLDNKSLEFYGLVEEGSIIKLSTGDSEDILKDIEIRGKEFYDMVIYGKRKPELILNISCTARNYVLLSDKKHSDEQKIYHSYLDKFSISGFLTFGEIGPDRFGKPGEFFNETSILVGLEEIDGLQDKRENT